MSAEKALTGTGTLKHPVKAKNAGETDWHECERFASAEIAIEPPMERLIIHEVLNQIHAADILHSSFDAEVDGYARE
jgi:hypothetical protein